MQTDHIDGDGLNNQRHNLRSATDLQNACNQTRKRAGCASQFRGVTWHRRAEKWQAQIKIGGHLKYLGSFRDEFAAARAYDAAGIARDPDHFTPNFSASWLAL
jgi:hypothetical protein